MNHMNNNVRLIGRLGMKTAANCALTQIKSR
jgi:hypothetical protein